MRFCQLRYVMPPCRPTEIGGRFQLLGWRPSPRLRSAQGRQLKTSVQGLRDCCGIAITINRIPNKLAGIVPLPLPSPHPSPTLPNLPHLPHPLASWLNSRVTPGVHHLPVLVLKWFGFGRRRVIMIIVIDGIIYAGFDLFIGWRKQRRFNYVRARKSLYLAMNKRSIMYPVIWAVLGEEQGRLSTPHN